MNLRGFLILLCGGFVTVGVAGAGAFQAIHDLHSSAAGHTAATPVAARQVRPAPAATQPAAASVTPSAPLATTSTAAATSNTPATTTATGTAPPNPQLAAAAPPAPSGVQLPPLRPHVAVCAVTPPPIAKKTVTANRKPILRKPPVHVAATQHPRLAAAQAPQPRAYPTVQSYPYYAGYTYYSGYPPTAYYRAY